MKGGTLVQATIGILDQHFSQAQALDSFAHTNTLLRLPDARADELFHFWTLDSTVILGMQDLKLPHLQSALQALSAAQYPYFVRNAGGLAVISDAQILNCSWFLKNTGTMSIDQAYLQFTQLMQDALAPFGKPIEHFEVTHSYCPGKFDLSINGKKFAGLAQRRTPKGIVIMLYLSVSGNQQARGELLRDFYRAGDAASQTHFAFPDVWPDSMANLDELLDFPITIAQLKERLLLTLSQRGYLLDFEQLPALLETPTYQTTYQTTYQKLLERNQKLHIA